jgi:protein-S-isoprenylcysteine O-methyltransferase Ste14
MLSLFLRNLFFTILKPGFVAGLVPYWIVRNNLDNILASPKQFIQYAGISVFLIGLVIMFDCIVMFAIKGRGTLSPLDPTKKLVVSGLYKFSRNPMYVGVTTILLGEAIFFQSGNLWYYLLFVFIAFNAFVMLVEEPRLRRDFGNEYYEYCRKVRRWF